MRHVLRALIILIIMYPAACLPFGSIAVGPHKSYPNILRWGWATQKPTRMAAIVEAIQHCDPARANCQAVIVFNDRCASLAIAANNANWGVGQGPNIAESEENATTICEALPGTSPACNIVRSICDGNPVGSPPAQLQVITPPLSQQIGEYFNTRWDQMAAFSEANYSTIQSIGIAVLLAAFLGLLVQNRRLARRVTNVDGRASPENQIAIRPNDAPAGAPIEAPTLPPPQHNAFTPEPTLLPPAPLADSPSPSETAAALTTTDLQSPPPVAAIPDMAREPQTTQLKLKRSQRQGTFGKIIFILDARMELTPEDQALVNKYGLGSHVVYESSARQKHAEATKAHLESTRDQPSFFAPPGQQALGVGKTLFRLARAGASAAMTAMALRITITSLAQGVHVECKSMNELVDAENAIVEAAQNLKAYLGNAVSFDGREDIVAL